METDASKAARVAVAKALNGLPYDAHTVASHLEYWALAQGEELHGGCVAADEAGCDGTCEPEGIGAMERDELEGIARLVHHEDVKQAVHVPAHHGVGSYRTCEREVCRRLAALLGER